jgi:glyoxylase-like metal-dependent hydrolase (beta-lactamase superfamily II)
MILEKILVGPMGVNCYVLAAKEGASAVIIDPGDQARKIKQVLDKYALRAKMVINTHGHYDHIGADDAFGTDVFVHKQDAGMLKDPMLNLSGVFAGAFSVSSGIKYLEDGQLIELDGIQLKVLHTPGHTPGGIVLLLEKPQTGIAFTGDTLFCRGVGRSDLSGGNEGLLIRSIKEKLFTLPPETRIYPGHGPDSTIGEEKGALL